jgi:hypothetical protein
MELTDSECSRAGKPGFLGKRGAHAACCEGRGGQEGSKAGDGMGRG